MKSAYIGRSANLLARIALLLPMLLLLPPDAAGQTGGARSDPPKRPAPLPIDPYTHPTVLTAGELTVVAGWSRAQWDAYMRPLLAARGGRLTCRPPLLMHAFIPPPYDRLITDHSLICE